MKTCIACGIEKDEKEFYAKDKNGRLSTSCKVCHNIKVKKWQNENRERVRRYVRKSCKKAYDENPDKYREKSAKKRMQNPDLHKMRVQKSYSKMQNNLTEHEIARRKRNSFNWRANNMDKVKAASASYKKRFPAKNAAKENRRRAMKLSATPFWLTSIQLAQIQEFYEIAAAKTFQTGIPHEVDHIHPLKNNLVCGLHVPWNLRVISAKENRLKNNKLIFEEVT